MLGVLALAVLAGCGKTDVRVGYTPAAEAENPAAVHRLRSRRVLDETAERLAAQFHLRHPLRVEADTCSGDPNAFYEPDPPPARIRLCVELVDDLHQFWSAEAADSLIPPEDVDDAIDGALRFTLYHEVGHALVDLLDLPAVGREEDAADQIATLLLDDGTEAGAQAALDGAEAYYEEPPNPDSAAYWDEHGLGAQRFYNVACLVYGRDPEARADLVGEDYLPKERADVCEEEYARSVAGWRRLLEPYLRQPLR